MLQLNPPLPVIVTSKGGMSGLCHFIDNSLGAEHHVLWAVAMDDTGEVYWVPNPEIRLMWNWSLERPPRPHKPA